MLEPGYELVLGPSVKRTDREPGFGITLDLHNAHVLWRSSHRSSSRAARPSDSERPQWNRTTFRKTKMTMILILVMADAGLRRSEALHRLIEDWQPHDRSLPTETPGRSSGWGATGSMGSAGDGRDASRASRASSKVGVAW